MIHDTFRRVAPCLLGRVEWPALGLGGCPEANVPT
jgi:hypothetical protein